jgi:hypothetical protein
MAELIIGKKDTQGKLLLWLFKYLSLHYVLLLFENIRDPEPFDWY